VNKLTKEITNVLQPSAALIVYTHEDFNSRRFYPELRNIGSDGLMGAGKPVNLNFIHSLIEKFSADSSSTPHGEMLKCMLYVDTMAGKYIWYSPPCKRYLYFSSSLNIPNGKYCIPGLIWMVKKEKLYIFSYRTKQASSGTQLYSAPFFNVRPDDGSVCLGNASLTQPVNNNFHNFTAYWEKKFFLSEFSHILGNSPTRSNLVSVLKNSTQTFDNEELIPIKNLKIKNIFE